MEQKKEFKRKKPNLKPKKKRGFSIKLKNANKMKVASVVLVVLLLVSIAAARVGGVTFSVFTDGFRTFIAKIGAGPGYPYSLSGINAVDLSVTNSDIVLLSDSEVRVIDSTAKEISNIQHNFDHPLMETSSGRILVYDIGGKSFKLHSKTRVLFENQTENIILTAALGHDGSVAVATKASGSESMLTVYDKKHSEAFKWACAKENIVSCDISPNGKFYVASVLGVDNGAVYSKVYIFDKKKTEAVASFEYPGSALTKVRFLGNDNIIVFGNNVCEIIKDNKTQSKIDVSVDTPSRLFVSDEGTAVLVLSKYAGTTQKVVKVIDKAGEEVFTTEVSGMVKSVSADGNYVSILTDSQIFIYDMKGEMTGRADVTSETVGTVVSSKRTYVFSSEGIVEYSSVELK